MQSADMMQDIVFNACYRMVFFIPACENNQN